MSYRFLSNSRALRGYGGTAPTVVHCLYDVTGSMVESLYSRDPLRYGGDGTKVCFKSNSFTAPPRVPVPTAPVSSCIRDLYGQTIYDIYGAPVCYVPRVKVVPVLTVAPPPPATPSETPQTVVLPSPAAVIPTVASETAVTLPPSTYSPPPSTFSSDAPAPVLTTSSSSSAALPVQEEPEELPPAEVPPEEDNKLLIGGILALLAVGAGVAYLKFKKG